MEYQIEICANSAESAAEAQRGGAARVELCAGMPEGGTTPSAGTIKAARRLLTMTRLHVIIRPRGGDFLYSPLECDVMREDIRMARDLGADGVVIGCLDAEGEVDKRMVEALVREADGLSVTFHRAFDMCRAPHRALEELIGLGCHRILTSGQRPTAMEGAPLLARLREQAAGRITIMPGCGVNAANIARLAAATGCREFHFSARRRRESTMRFRNAAVSMGGTVTVDEYAKDVTDASEVARAVSALRGPEASVTP